MGPPFGSREETPEVSRRDVSFRRLTAKQKKKITFSHLTKPDAALGFGTSEALS